MTVIVPDLERLLDDEGVERSCDLQRLDRATDRWVDCGRPAAWIFRTRLSCGHKPDRRSILVCQDCTDTILGEVDPDDLFRPVVICPKPRCTVAAEILAVEPLR